MQEPNRAIDAHETQSIVTPTDSDAVKSVLDHASNPAAHTPYPTMDNVVSWSTPLPTTTVCGVITNVEYEGDSIYSATVSEISNPPVIGESVFTKDTSDKFSDALVSELSDKHHGIVQTRNSIENTRGFSALLRLGYFNLERNEHLANQSWVGMGDDDVRTCVTGTVHDMCLNEYNSGTYDQNTDGWVSGAERDLAIMSNTMWTVTYKYNQATDACFKRACNLTVLVDAVLADVNEQI